MGHRNARLTVHGRRLLVWRVRDQGMPVAHVAKAMGISRQCAHRWVARFDTEGDAGLEDRSSRPHRSPTRTSPEIEQAVVAARVRYRRGPDWLGPELGIPARTVTRILRRHGVARLAECDPLTGLVIRAAKTTALRYERDRPGELIHVDVRSAASPPVAAGGLGGARSGKQPPKRSGASATTTCTQRSTTTAASPTPRSTPMKGATPVGGSWPGPLSPSPNRAYPASRRS